MTILIEYHPDNCWAVEHEDPWLDYSGVAYTLGHWPKDKPNYPVPSTLGAVFYEKDRIGIEDPDDPDWTPWSWHKEPTLEDEYYADQRMLHQELYANVETCDDPDCPFCDGPF